MKNFVTSIATNGNNSQLPSWLPHGIMHTLWHSKHKRKLTPG